MACLPRFSCRFLFPAQEGIFLTRFSIILADTWLPLSSTKRCGVLWTRLWLEPLGLFLPAFCLISNHMDLESPCIPPTWNVFKCVAKIVCTSMSCLLSLPILPMGGTSRMCLHVGLLSPTDPGYRVLLRGFDEAKVQYTHKKGSSRYTSFERTLLSIPPCRSALDLPPPSREPCLASQRQDNPHTSCLSHYAGSSSSP